MALFWFSGLQFADYGKLWKVWKMDTEISFNFIHSIEEFYTK
jgi:hypothetical protein